MHGLVRHIFIAFGCLARAQERQHCLPQIELHEFLDGKISVVYDEGAGKWVCLLDSVAREVKNVHVRVLQACQYSRNDRTSTGSIGRS
jgi:hypothetical protein